MTSKRMRVDWRGYIPAITTPFDRDGAMDFPALGRLLEWLHGEGMHGLVVAGTTGEWTSISAVERHALFNAVGTQMKGKLPLIAGCTAFTAAEVVEFTVSAAAAGFEGALVTPPPYIRPGEDEIVNFYRAVSEASALPICVYNWPPGTGIDMPFSVLERLAALENVVAIKQSTGDLRAFTQTYFGLKDQVRVFGHSMDDAGLALLKGAGGDGTMGAGGVLGRAQPDFYNHIWAGDFDAARACGRQDRVIMDAWYTPNLVGRFGSGPAILKAALNVQNLPGGHVRAPLMDVSDTDLASIRATLASLGRV